VTVDSLGKREWPIYKLKLSFDSHSNWVIPIALSHPCEHWRSGALSLWFPKAIII